MAEEIEFELEEQPGLVALVGATGAIGKSVAAALQQQKRPYRVIGRTRTALEAMVAGYPLAEVMVWDPDDEASIRAAVHGAAAVVYAVGVPYTEFQLHPIIMKKVVEAAIEEEVDRLLLIGTLYVFGRAQSETITEEHPREPHTFKGKMRKQQEDLVLETHSPLGMKTSVLRLPDFYGPGVEGSLLADLFKAARQGRKAKMVGPVDKPHEFVFVPDVGPVATRLLDTPGTFGQAWNLGGAGTTTQLELARLAYGDKPRLMVAGKSMLRFMGLFNPFMKELLEMHYLMTEPLIVDDTALRELLGEVDKTLYPEGVRQCLAAAA